MGIDEEIRLLGYEAKNLSEFLSRACELRGLGLTRASLHCGLSKGALAAYVSGARRPNVEALVKMSRYFGVGVATLAHLAGYADPGGAKRGDPSMQTQVEQFVRVLDKEELEKWFEYAEMLLLYRQRKILEGNDGQAEGE